MKLHPSEPLKTACCGAGMSAIVDFQAMAGKTVPFLCDACGGPAKLHPSQAGLFEQWECVPLNKVKLEG